MIAKDSEEEIYYAECQELCDEKVAKRSKKIKKPLKKTPAGNQSATPYRPTAALQVFTSYIGNIMIKHTEDIVTITNEGDWAGKPLFNLKIL